MTDVIDRLESEIRSGSLLGEREGSPAEPPEGSSKPKGAGGSVGVTPVAVLGALVAGCTAMLTLVAAAAHTVTSAPSALLFLVAWSQGLVAVALVVRPSRRRLWAVALADLVAVVSWALLGRAHPGPGAVMVGTGLALSIVGLALCLVLAVAPGTGRRWSSSVLVLGSVVPVGILVVASTAIFSLPKAHPAAAAAPPPRSSALAAAKAALATTVPVPGQSSSNFMRVALGNDSEKGELTPYRPLPLATQELLNQQLLEAEQAALRYPTVADAKAAGMILAGGMAPGVGAHYQLMSASTLQGVNPDGSINAAHPASWIYASTADNAPVVGVMYVAMTKNAPSGFAGPNDHWHQHANVCIQFKNGQITVPFAADTSVTPQECANVHGIFMKRTVWMVHAWVVPGWGSPQGVFSHANLHVYCPGNTDLVDPIGLCLRQQ